MRQDGTKWVSCGGAVNFLYDHSYYIQEVGFVSGTPRKGGMIKAGPPLLQHKGRLFLPRINNGGSQAEVV